MASTGRIPLWLIALVGGGAAFGVLAIFFYVSNDFIKCNSGHVRKC